MVPSQLEDDGWKAGKFLQDICHREDPTRAERRFSKSDPDHHSNAYEVDACTWSNIPDIDFSMQDDYPWAIGQFVWTGFDYLGELTPYDNDAWPNHSSCKINQ